MPQLKAVDSDLKVDVFSEEGRSTVHVEVGESLEEKELAHLIYIKQDFKN